MPYTKTRLSDFSDIKSARLPLFTEIVPAPSGRVGMVSGVVPLVSIRPLPISLTRHLGLLPRRDWSTLWTPGSRRRQIHPVQMRLSQFLRLLPLTPFAPLVMIKEIAEAIHEQAEKELNLESGYREQLLELKIRYELGEITEEQYKKREKELTKELEGLREKEEMKKK